MTFACLLFLFVASIGLAMYGKALIERGGLDNVIGGVVYFGLAMVCLLIWTIMAIVILV